MKPMLPASGFCLSRSVRPDDAAEPLTSFLTGVELDLVSCICSSRIDACCCLEDGDSNAQRPRGDCGKWFTLAAIGSGTRRETAGSGRFGEAILIGCRSRYRNSKQ